MLAAAADAPLQERAYLKSSHEGISTKRRFWIIATYGITPTIYTSSRFVAPTKAGVLNSEFLALPTF